RCRHRLRTGHRRDRRHLSARVHAAQDADVAVLAGRRRSRRSPAGCGLGGGTWRRRAGGLGAVRDHVPLADSTHPRDRPDVSGRLRPRRHARARRRRRRRLMHGDPGGDELPRAAARRVAPDAARHGRRGLLRHRPPARPRIPVGRHQARPLPIAERRPPPPRGLAGLPADPSRHHGARQAAAPAMTAESLTMPRRLTPVPAAPEPAVSNTRLAIVIVITAETLLFTGLIGMYLVFRLSAPEWPPPDLPRLPATVAALNTLVLFASLVPLTRALMAVRRGEEAGRHGVHVAAALGTVF